MSEKPSILVIHTDQQRFDCVGILGNPDIETPNLDQLARDGVRYTNSFCPFPVCTPSRYSLLTGLYVHQHLGWSNHCTLPSGLPTFPKELRKRGYRTTAVGKMHFTPTYLDVGFDNMRLAEQHGPGRYDDDYHRWLKELGLCDRIDLTDQVNEFRRNAPDVYWETLGALQSDLDEEHYSTTWIAEQAISDIEKWNETGNLLMVGFIKPHHPFDPPAPWANRYDPNSLALLPGWTEQCLDQDLHTRGFFPNKDMTESQLRRAMAFYYASISQIDHQVGRMISLLKKRGLYDNTMIIFTSDHGDYLGFHHLLLKGNNMYDPLVKVPLIIKYPNQKNAGAICDGLVNNVDVAPTILRCANVDPPKSMMGTDLSDLQVEREFVFAETNWPNGHFMIRTKSRKLLLRRNPADSLFFDLEKDPLEMVNLFHHPDYQDEIRGMRDRLYYWYLFEANTKVHLDENAPVIDAENVPDREGKSAEELRRYFADRMSEAYEFKR